MTRLFLFSGLLLALGSGLLPFDDPPQATISNGLIETTLYLPDASRGYYQGTRFDWSGAFKRLDYRGHHYVAPWFDNYNPKTHDAISGPVDAFTPLDFATTRPGDSFVNIGVGRLRKPDDKPYAISTYYDITDPGTWTVKPDRDAVTFTHVLTGSDGYGYQYTKTVRLLPGKPVLLLEHTLKNTGRRPIETSVYNHNFFIIDQQPTGPSVVIRFPYGVQGDGKGFGSTILARGDSLTFTRDLQKGEQVFSAGLRGFGPTAAGYDIRIENRKTGAGLRTTADQPLEKLVFWACATTSCPEPYVRIQAAPGQSFRWNVRYEFYQNPVP